MPVYRHDQYRGLAAYYMHCATSSFDTEQTGIALCFLTSFIALLFQISSRFEVESCICGLEKDACTDLVLPCKHIQPERDLKQWHRPILKI